MAEFVHDVVLLAHHLIGGHRDLGTAIHGRSCSRSVRPSRVMRWRSRNLPARRRRS
jgi:hypothetical protein